MLAAPAVKMDKNKDFLHKSWFERFPQDRLVYYAFGNTQATDFFYNLDLGEDLDVLMIGAGEKVTCHELSTNSEDSSCFLKKI